MDLQAAINTAVPGSTIRIPDNERCVGNFVTDKPITLEGGPGSSIYSPNAMPAFDIKPATGPVVLKTLEFSVLDTAPLIYDIIRYGSGGADQNSLDKVPQGLTVDRCDIHGQPKLDSQRGIAANGANFKITNSKIWEIHGRGYDTQAICSWNGPGPFMILDCYLEAAGENIMFGGAAGSIPGLIPSDITIKRNHCFKPLSWYINDPSYAGLHWTVKNLFELKNARRVVVDGNVFENNWADAQAGRSILFTPRPNDSGPSAVVEDVEFTNNVVKNVGSGVHLLGLDDLATTPAVILHRVRIANNVFDNIDGPRFGSNGAFATVINGTDGVTIEHNTVIHTGSMVIADYLPNTNFVYRSNISRHNDYGIFGSGHGIGNPAIDYYFPGSTITDNVIAKEVNAPWNVDQIYPAGQVFPTTLAEVFSDVSKYQVAPAYAGKGADYNAILAAQGGTTPPDPIPTPIPPTTSIIRKVAWPTGEAKQNAVVELQWRERFRFKRHLSGAWAEFEYTP